MVAEIRQAEEENKRGGSRERSVGGGVRVGGENFNREAVPIGLERRVINSSLNDSARKIIGRQTEEWMKTVIFDNRNAVLKSKANEIEQLVIKQILSEGRNSTRLANSEEGKKAIFEKYITEANLDSYYSSALEEVARKYNVHKPKVTIKSASDRRGNAIVRTLRDLNGNDKKDLFTQLFGMLGQNAPINM